MIYVWLIIGLFVMAAGAGIVWKYNSAIERAVAAEQRASVAEEGLKAYAASYKDLQGKYKTLDVQLAKKIKADIVIRKDLANVQAQLEDLKRRDPAVQTWADAPVPEPVIKLLREQPDIATNKGVGGSSDTKGSNGTDTKSDGGAVTIRPN